MTDDKVGENICHIYHRKRANIPSMQRPFNNWGENLKNITRKKKNKIHE